MAYRKLQLCDPVSSISPLPHECLPLLRSTMPTVDYSRRRDRRCQEVPLQNKALYGVRDSRVSGSTSPVSTPPVQTCACSNPLDSFDAQAGKRSHCSRMDLSVFRITLISLSGKQPQAGVLSAGKFRIFFFPFCEKFLNVSSLYILGKSSRVSGYFAFLFQGSGCHSTDLKDRVFRKSHNPSAGPPLSRWQFPFHRSTE